MRQFIGRQELTEKKRSGFEVDSWIRSNSYRCSKATGIETILVFADSLFEVIADVTEMMKEK